MKDIKDLQQNNLLYKREAFFVLSLTVVQELCQIMILYQILMLAVLKKEKWCVRNVNMCSVDYAYRDII